MSSLPPPLVFGFFVCTWDTKGLSRATENSSLSQRDIVDAFSQNPKTACNAWLTMKSNCEGMVRSSIFPYIEETKAIKFMPLIKN